ncbi:MAG: hypothetical protein ACI9W4_002055 [Rhodothermales bacterium]
METSVVPHKPGPLERLLDTGPARKLLAFHETHPQRAGALFFMVGVSFDAATIFRIDSVVDNVIIITYLSLLCVLYVAATLHDAGELRNVVLLRFTRWYPIASQFLLGALFSMFVFFYSQSASLTETSVFLVLLVGLMVANEVLHDRMFSARLRLGLLFFVLASYLVYSVPIVTGIMNHGAFAAGLLLAAGLVGLILWYLWKRGVFRDRSQIIWAGATVAILLALLEVSYVLNWIPPVPMAVREAGVYHFVKKSGPEYRMRYAKPAWYKPFASDEQPFRYFPGDTVYVYTAVFAPSRLDKEIVHVWERHRPEQDDWLESDRINYFVSGGRDHGYRGYTQKRVIQPGTWRVRVETSDGRLLTRIRFHVVPVSERVTDWKWRTG